MKLPISLNEVPSLSLGASEGSRVLSNQGFYRSHDGIDFNAPKGTPAVSTINCRVPLLSEGLNSPNGGLSIITSDEKYRVTYLHMPPSSHQIKPGDKVTVGEPVGEVGGWGCPPSGCSNEVFPAHLHYEVWEKREVLVFKQATKTYVQEEMYVPLDPRQVDLSAYQKR